MCSEYLRLTSTILFSIATLFLCFYFYRIQRAFKPAAFKYCVIPTVAVFALGIILGYHAVSDCDRSFITWGASILGLYISLCIIETCHWIVKMCQEDD